MTLGDNAKKKEILNNPLDTEKCIKNALTTVCV